MTTEERQIRKKIAENEQKIARSLANMREILIAAKERQIAENE